MNIPDGSANCRYLFRCEGVDDTMGFSLGHDCTVLTDPSAIAAFCSTYFEANFVASTAAVMDGWSYIGTQVTYMAGGEPFPGEFATNITGTSSFESPPVNLSLLVRKTTGQGGRKGRGRMFWPPFNTSEDKVASSGILDNVWVGLIQGGLDTWFSDLVENDLAPQLFHSDPLAMATPINGFVLSTLCATQRRRLR